MGDTIFAIVKEEMRKHMISKYQVDSVLVDIPANGNKTIEGNNDFHIFVDANCDSNMDGRIRGTGGGRSLNIIPQVMLTVLYKHQAFKGAVTIVNNNPTYKLAVEFLRVTPVFERSLIEN